MTEALATLDETFAPSRGASAHEQFRAARAVARRERADISDKTLDQIAANWQVALEDEASDAGDYASIPAISPVAHCRSSSPDSNRSDGNREG